MLLSNDVVIHTNEAQMFASKEASIETLTSLNEMFGYFLERNFFVHGGQEVHNINHNQFQLVVDDFDDDALR